MDDVQTETDLKYAFIAVPKLSIAQDLILGQFAYGYVRVTLGGEDYRRATVGVVMYPVDLEDKCMSMYNCVQDNGH